jgi:hypothetical protein
MTLTRRTAACLLAGAPALVSQREADAEAGSTAPGAERMGRYNIVWNSPSQDATGVMPIGNGDIINGGAIIDHMAPRERRLVAVQK